MRRALLCTAPLLVALAVVALRLLTGGAPAAPVAPVAEEAPVRDRAPARLEVPAAAAAPEAASVEATRAPVAPDVAPEPAPYVDPTVGDAVLELSFVDRATGLAVESDVDLWLLGIPEDERFTAGDEVVRQVEVPTGGLVLEGLAPGRYRARCGAQRASAPDPPEFHVLPGRNAHTIQLDRPRTYTARARFVDEEGSPLPKLRRGSTSQSWSQTLEPDWVERRWAKGSEDDVVIGLGGGGGGSFSGRRSSKADADGWHALGSFREASRAAPVRRTTSHSATDRARVRCVLPEPAGDEGVEVIGVLPRLAPYRERVLLPDGRPAVEAGADLDVWSEGRPYDPSDPGAWRDLPIHVDVTLEGYAPLRAVHRLAAGEFPWTELVPAD